MHPSTWIRCAAAYTLSLALAPPAFAVTLVPGDVLAASKFGDAIVAIDPTTGQQTVVSSGGLFVSVEALKAASDGSIIVVDEGFSFTASQLIRVNPATGAQQLVTDDLDLPLGLALAPGGIAYVSQPGAIVAVSLATGAVTPVTSFQNLVEPNDMILDTDGSLLVADPGAKAILRVDPATGAQSVVVAGTFDPNVCFGSGLNDVRDIAMDASGDLLAVQTGCVVRVNPTTGTVSTGFFDLTLGFLTGIAVDETGRLLLSESNMDAVFRVDLAGPSKTTVSAGFFLDGTSDVALVTVAPEPASGAGAAGLLALAALHVARRTARWAFALSRELP